MLSERFHPAPDKTSPVRGAGPSEERTSPQPERASRGSHRRAMYMIAVVLAILIVCAGGGTLAYFVYKHAHPSGTLPSEVVSEVTIFTPYYPTVSATTGFTLEKNSVRYQNGILEFVMKNQVGKTLVFTEEPEPASFNPSTIQATKQVNTEFGEGFVTDIAARTTGSLITNDGSWIIINAPNPVGANLMQQVIQALAPIRKP